MDIYGVLKGRGTSIFQYIYFICLPTPTPPPPLQTPEQLNQKACVLLAQALTCENPGEETSLSEGGPCLMGARTGLEKMPPSMQKQLLFEILHS